MRQDAPREPDARRSPGERIRRAVTAGTEILISVLAALVFFSIFLVALSVIMPQGVTMREVVSPSGFEERATGRGFSASLDDFVSLGHELIPRAALLTVLNTTVKRKPADGIVWGSVESGADLQDGDAVQTTREGTALLTFGRGKQLQMEQNSLVVVRANPIQSGGDDPSGGPSVHVMLGELWGTVGGEGSGAPGVSITAPGAAAQVAPEKGATAAQFRIRVREDKTTVLSVYRGVAAVVVKGRTVRVAANQFVSMDSARGIAAPVALPDAPALLAPEAGMTVRYRELAPRVEFRWSPVPGADGYRLLVSRSPVFQGEVLDRTVPETRFSYGNLDSGPHYWRVSALRAGAEGPPSAPRAVVVANTLRAPTLDVTFPPDIVHGDQCTLAGMAEPGVRVIVAGQQVSTDALGRFKSEVTLKRGFNVVVVEATDRVGNTAYKSKVVEARF